MLRCKHSESDWVKIDMYSPLEVNIDANTQVRVYGIVSDYGGAVKVRAEIWHKDLDNTGQKNAQM